MAPVASPVASSNTSLTGDWQWWIVSRWEEFAGERRANLMRLVSIAALYAVELLNYHVWRQVDEAFHVPVTALAVAWVMLAAGVHVCLEWRIFPSWLKYLSTGCDLVLLTCMLLLAGGPASPLVAGYFLILCVAALRFSLPLVWFATAGAVGGYVFLLGYARWFLPRPDMLLPRHHQALIVICLVLAGVALGQVVRRVRALAEDLAQRVRFVEKSS